MEQITQKLEAVFRRIEQERMRDIPVCHPALKVEAVGFREWGNYYLGVMVTPWFMNLMLLPVRSDDFAGLKEGGKQVHVFPSGRYEFISGQEADLGSYLVCSLFSPMHDFANQQTAVATANQVLAELMDVRNRDSISTEAQEDIADTRTHEQKQTGGAPLSRRDFLRGGARRSGEHNRGD